MQSATFQEGNPVFFHKHEDVQAFLTAYKAKRGDKWRATLRDELVMEDDHLTYWMAAKKDAIANIPLAEALLHYNAHNKTLPSSLKMLVGLPILNMLSSDTLDSTHREESIRDRFFAGLFIPSKREDLDATVESLKLGIEQIDISMDVGRVVSKLPKVLSLLVKKGIHDHLFADLFPEANREALDASIKNLRQTSIQTVLSHLQIIATLLRLNEGVEELLRKLNMRESLRRMNIPNFIKGLQDFEEYSYYSVEEHSYDYTAPNEMVETVHTKKIETVHTCLNSSLLSLLLAVKHPSAQQKKRHAFELKEYHDFTLKMPQQLEEHHEHYEIQRRSYKADIFIYSVQLVISYAIAFTVVECANSLSSLLSITPTHFSPNIIIPSLFIAFFASLIHSNIFRKIGSFNTNIFEIALFAVAFIAGMKAHKASSHQPQEKYIDTLLLVLGHSARACLLSLVYSATQASLDRLEHIEHATQEIQVVEKYFLKRGSQTDHHALLESDEASLAPRMQL